MAAIAACISPYKAIRDENRALIGRFVEVYCEAPLDALAARDPKGLYKKARAGEIKEFTGISDPYEAPEAAELIVNTEGKTVDESAEQVLAHLRAHGFIK